MRHTIIASISKGDDYYVAECLGVKVITQGRTLDETTANLQEAVALCLEGEDLAELRLAPNPILLVMMEFDLATRGA